MSAQIQTLVRLVGRAFYTDEHVVVLEALLRNRYLNDAQLAEFLSLSQKQVRKYCGELESDGLILREELNDKGTAVRGGSRVEYWYIDPKHVYNVVRYRLYLMQKKLREDEQREIERQTFRCSNDDCGREYTALEAQLLLTPDVYEFRCGHCNSVLVECDNNETLEKIKNRLTKFTNQMSSKEKLHNGIYDCLAKIKEWTEANVLPSNLPSELRAAEIESATSAGGNGNRGGGGGGGGGRGSSDKNSISFGKYDEAKIVVNIAENTNQDEYFLLNHNKPKEEITLQSASTTSSTPLHLATNKISSSMTTKYKPKTSLTDAASASADLLNTSSSADKSEVGEKELREMYEHELRSYREMDKQKEDEEFEDMEWEWCDNSPQEMYDESLRSVMVPVRGCPVPIVKLTDDDLLTMTPEEYTSFYELCRSMMI